MAEHNGIYFKINCSLDFIFVFQINRFELGDFIRMNRVIILAIICIVIVNGTVKDDLRDKATEALNQGGKVKV
jgi:hypothetical protein